MKSAFDLFVFVTLGALGGMVMGGLFGWVAGRMAPDFFAALFPLGPPNTQPVETAVVLGAFGGTCCGGGLAVFALTLNRVDVWLKSRGAH